MSTHSPVPGAKSTFPPSPASFKRKRDLRRVQHVRGKRDDTLYAELVET